MTRMSCFCDASVIRQVDGQEVATLERVDLLNLASIDFDKIIINTDVDLGNGKGKPLPDFSKVEINGGLDCSSFSISEGTVLPRGITSLKCFYSFNDLGVLQSILPDSVKHVFVRNSIINAVKKSAVNLAFAQDFIRKFPGLEIIGKTDTLKLREVIEKIISEKNKKIEKTNKRETSTYNIQTKGKKEGYLSLLEVANELKKFPDFKEISVKDLKKAIKTFLYAHSDDPQWGSLHNYLPEDKIQDVALALLIQENDAEKEEVGKPVKAPAEKDKKEQIVKRPVKEAALEDFKVINIKKFFDKRIWGQVCKACKNNKAALIEFLKNISDVNLNPLQKDSRIGANRVACIKDGELKLVPNLELKNSCYITQGFGRGNNRPRVVWCIIPGGNLVASAFFANHGDGKNKTLYNYTISSTDLRDSTNEGFNRKKQDYLDVDTLLADFEYGKPDVPEQKQEEKVVIEENGSDNIDNKFLGKTEKDVTEEQAIVESHAVESGAETVVEKTETVVPVPVKKGRPRIPKKQDTSDILYQASYELTDVFDLLNKDIMNLKQQLVYETDTIRSIELARILAGKLEDKQLLEQNIEIAKRTFEVLKRYMGKQGNEKR